MPGSGGDGSRASRSEPSSPPGERGPSLTGVGQESAFSVAQIYTHTGYVLHLQLSYDFISTSVWLNENACLMFWFQNPHFACVCVYSLYTCI